MQSLYVFQKEEARKDSVPKTEAAAVDGDHKGIHYVVLIMLMHGLVLSSIVVFACLLLTFVWFPFLPHLSFHEHSDEVAKEDTPEGGDGEGKKKKKKKKKGGDKEDDGEKEETPQVWY